MWLENNAVEKKSKFIYKYQIKKRNNIYGIITRTINKMITIIISSSRNGYHIINKKYSLAVLSTCTLRLELSYTNIFSIIRVPNITLKYVRQLNFQCLKRLGGCWSPPSWCWTEQSSQVAFADRKQSRWWVVDVWDACGTLDRVGNYSCERVVGLLNML